MRKATQADVLAHFDQRGNDPAAWRVYARHLHAASLSLCTLWLAAVRAVRDEKASPPADLLGHLAPAAMLRGMACECYLKALGLERGKFVLASGGRYNRKIPGLKNQHNLVRLAELVGFPLIGPEEERALRDMSRARSRPVGIQSKWTGANRPV